MYRTLAEVIEDFDRARRESNRPEDRRLANDYLAALAPMLASVVMGQDILRQLPAFDRLLGHTRLTDDAPFRAALDKWGLFRNEYEKFVLGGMTVNERLVALGTMEAYERACTAGDALEVRRLLAEARVDESSIGRLIENL